MPERFRGEVLTMGRYTNSASFTHTRTHKQANYNTTKTTRTKNQVGIVELGNIVANLILDRPTSP